jgi:hypothetical protein
MKEQMKKLLMAFLLAGFILAGIFPGSVQAKNQVMSIDIDAVIYEDGSMYVTQVWDVEFDEGTEAYIPMRAPSYLTISDLRVADGNSVYQVLKEWDPDANFKEKARKCGINYTADGYEICFGLSEYGHNRYAIEYRLANVVGGYDDLDGVNFRFVNSGMNTTPTDVNIEIRLADGTPITDEISDIWAFGYEGRIAFEEGLIRAYTEKPLTADNHVTVMFSFNKGVLKPARIETVSFETVKEQAFSGSDYDYDASGDVVSTLLAVLITVFSIVMLVALILLILKLNDKAARRKKQKFTQQFDYFRDIPNNGNTNATYTLGRLFEVCEDGTILGTGMLRLIQLGCLAPVSREEVGLMGRTKEIVSLRLMGSNHREMNEYDEYLYTVLEGAAGPDGVLQPKELPKFAEKNDTLLRNYINKCEEAGRQYLNERRALKRWDMPSKLKYLTPQGRQELGELLGFKRYLEDFSLVDERGVQEMPIWQELLSYALLFGLADRIAEQMRELYPQIEAEIMQYNQTLTAAYSYYHLMYVKMRQAEERREQAARSGGSGGFSSLGGGGGSIGGGSGGGTR